MWLEVTVQEAPFDLSNEEVLLRSKNLKIGGMVAFQGVVRTDQTACAIKALFIEYYPVFTEQEIIRMADQARKRWPLIGCRIIHRVGKLLPNEPIVLVLVASEHRRAAFEAAQFLMDYIKKEAPFWKREELRDGSHYWVKAS